MHVVQLVVHLAAHRAQELCVITLLDHCQGLVLCDQAFEFSHIYCRSKCSLEPSLGFCYLVPVFLYNSELLHHLAPKRVNNMISAVVVLHFVIHRLLEDDEVIHLQTRKIHRFLGASQHLCALNLSLRNL